MSNQTETAAGPSLAAAPPSVPSDRQPPVDHPRMYGTRDLARLYKLHSCTIRIRVSAGDIPKPMKGYKRPMRWSAAVIDKHLVSLGLSPGEAA